MTVKQGRNGIWRMFAGATALAALTACGGGGGGNAKQTDGGSAQPASVDTRSGNKIRLGGVVSKGLLGNANVRVLAINSDGSLNEAAPLATGSTLDDTDPSKEGSYTTTEFTISGSYVVEVKAKACDNTATGVNLDASHCSYHRDETLGARQYLPTGFKIRAVVASTPADDTVNVTLFSEFAVRAALKAGGLSAVNVAQAQAMVNNLFGTTDLNTVKPQALSSTLSPAEARLAAMLKAASQIASSPSSLAAMGCGSYTAGSPDATVCVVDKLSGNANSTTYVGDSGTITATLNAALLNVAQGSAELLAEVSTTSDKLSNPSLSVPAPAADVGAYTNIRNFFTDLVDHAKALFNKDQGEPLFAEARQFETAVKNVGFGGENLARTVSVFQLGAELYAAYQQTAGTSEVSKFYRDDDLGNLYELSPAGRGCYLADPADNVIASGDAVDHVICYVNQAYNVDYASGVPTATPGETRYTATLALHSITLTPVKDAGGKLTGFSYSAVSLVDPGRHAVTNFSARYAVDEEGVNLTSSTYSPQRTSTTAPADPWSTARTFTGTVSNVTYTPNFGHVKSITLQGELPDTFKSGHLTPDHDTGNPTTNLARNTLTGMQASVVNPTYDANEKLVDPAEASFAGTLSTYLADGSTLDASMAFTNGGLTNVNDRIDSVRFDVLSHNASASFKGSVNAARQPNDGVLVNSATGAVYNNATAAGTPFIQATFSGKNDKSHFIGGARSATNYEVTTLSFDGFVRAPNKPKIRVTLTGAIKLTSDTSQFGLNASDAVSGDYFIYNSDDSLKRDITFTFKAPDTNPTPGARVVTEVVDPTNKLAFSFGYSGHNQAGDSSKADTWADVLVNKVVRGKLDTDTGDLPKVFLGNGDFFSLDTGTVQY